MKNTHFKVLIIVVMAAWLFGCTDIIEPNISGEHVKLLAPTDSLTTIYSSIALWWDPIKNANSYSVQIVSPSFDFIERLMMDTITETNQVVVSLFPGQYQWRVKAINYSYETEYTTSTFFIDSTLDLSQQKVVLTSPIDADTNNNVYIELRWDFLYNANKYVVVAENQDGIIASDTLMTNRYFLTLYIDGEYSWKVKGVNNYSETIYFRRGFFRYTHIPNAPTLVLPVNLSNFSSDETIEFSWTRDQLTVPSIQDSIFISNDSIFSDCVVKASLDFPQFEDVLEVGTYYWKVKSIDKAGNESNFSEKRSFIINN